MGGLDSGPCATQAPRSAPILAQPCLRGQGDECVPAGGLGWEGAVSVQIGSLHRLGSGLGPMQLGPFREGVGGHGVWFCGWWGAGFSGPQGLLSEGETTGMAVP